MRLRWTRLALADFEQAHDHIAQESPEAARLIAQRILDATEVLVEHPRIGRDGQGDNYPDRGGLRLCETNHILPDREHLGNRPQKTLAHGTPAKSVPAI